MQPLYTSCRRLVASFLLALILIVAALTALRGLGTAAIVVSAGAVVAGALLSLVAASATPRFGFDLPAFLSAAFAISVSWGTDAIGPGLLIHLPALVAAIAFATMALVLRTEAGAGVTGHRR